eukprot:14779155-Heterocapsa_arctica.AAC.1
MVEMEASTVQARGLAVGGTMQATASASHVQRSQGMLESRKPRARPGQVGVGGRLIVFVLAALLGL